MKSFSRQSIKALPNEVEKEISERYLQQTDCVFSYYCVASELPNFAPELANLLHETRSKVRKTKT